MNFLRSFTRKIVFNVHEKSLANRRSFCASEFSKIPLLQLRVLNLEILRTLHIPHPAHPLNTPTEKIASFYCCQGVYKEWRQQSRFRRIPQDGVYVSMRYVDSYDETLETYPKKTVLMLHGVPGTHKVFTPLTEGLKAAGMRAIVPTFPDTLYLPGIEGYEIFRHSIEEKTTVFRNFLKRVKVEELDCIVAHSSAVYPALELLFDPSLKVKSLILFNTGGHKKPIAMRPYWIIWICAQLYLTFWGKVFVQHTGRFIMKYILFTPIKDNDLDGVCLLAVTMMFSQYWKAKEKFIEISKRQIPTLYCFSENDPIVEKRLSYKVISLLGGSKKNVDIHDKNGKLEKSGERLSWLTLASFKEGGHYLFRKHSDECLQKVLKFLNELDEIPPTSKS